MPKQIAKQPWRTKSWKPNGGSKSSTGEDNSGKKIVTIWLTFVSLSRDIGNRFYKSQVVWWNAPMNWSRLLIVFLAVSTFLIMARAIRHNSTNNTLKISRKKMAPMTAAAMHDISTSATAMSLTTTKFADVLKGSTFERHGLTWPAYLKPWVRFAEENQCLITSGYEGIDNDLKPFRELGNRMDTKVLKFANATLLWLNYCRVREGGIKCRLQETGRFPIIDEGMMNYVHKLPDMDFVVNTEPGPRLMVPDGVSKFKDWSVDKTLLRRCSNESGIMSLDGMHSAFLQQMPSRTSQLLPVLSDAKIDGCHRDILFPQWNARTDPLVGAHLEPLAYTDWDDKLDGVKWKGRTTGGTIKDGYNWEDTQRFRLVKRFGFPNSFGEDIETDISFVGTVQCELPEHECKNICLEYKCTQEESLQDMFRYKFILDIDGNAQSDLFMKLAYSGSVVLKGTVWRSWWSERVKPWVHYVPMDLTLNKLNATINWLHDNEDKARAIGANLRKLARTQLRDIDLDCYVFRLLLEYSALFKPFSV